MKKVDIKVLGKAVGEWADRQFPHQTVTGKLKHLESEVQELLGDPVDIEEYADCLMLLLDAARLAGITPFALVTATWEKLAINKRRKWGKPNADGFVEHLK